MRVTFRTDSRDSLTARELERAGARCTGRFNDFYEWEADRPTPQSLHGFPRSAYVGWVGVTPEDDDLVAVFTPRYDGGWDRAYARVPRPEPFAGMEVEGAWVE